ncbi:hypothetical protein M0805_009066 [Coniferiporia weirii]|nr:hypothetical protein M0805_009066 [Coniferiporia weirii]
MYLAISLLVYFGLSRGILVNRTVDDELGDSVTGALPTYQGSWNYGPTCQDCLEHLDPSFVFQGTWHEATWDPGDPSERMVNISFTGSAVFVFIVLANIIFNDTHTITSLSFILDGETMGNFFHSPALSTDYEYNVPAYSNENLVNAPHYLTMETTGDFPTLVLFDYLVYSVDDEETSVPTPARSISPSVTSVPTPAGSISPSVMSVPTSTGSISPSVTSVLPASSTPPPQENMPPDSGRKTSVMVGGLSGGIGAVALVAGLLLLSYKRRGGSTVIRQDFSDCVERGRRPPSRLFAPLYRREATTGNRKPKSPANIDASTPADRRSSHCTTIMSPTDQSSDADTRAYAQTITEAEFREQGRAPGLQALSKPHKSAERQLEIFRQIERARKQPEPSPTRDVPNFRPGQVLGRIRGYVHEEVLQEQAVFFLDDVESFRTMRANAGAFRAGSSPPPDYSTEPRRHSVTSEKLT